MKTHQYLFDCKKFYTLKSNKKFPSTLCFPEFYALTIAVILNWYSFMVNNDGINEYYSGRVKNIHALILEFFDYLQDIINLIFGKQSKIFIIAPQEIHKIMTSYSFEASDMSILYLEKILRDEESVFRYRKNLIDISLNFYNIDNLDQLINNLCENRVCISNIKESLIEIPPPSCHYVSFKCNINDANIPWGPGRWGPMYWSVFHSLADNALNGNFTDARTINTLNNFIQYLPFILPCPACRHHYYRCITPSSIPELKDVAKLKQLFDKIHHLVTKNIHTGGKVV